MKSILYYLCVICTLVFSLQGNSQTKTDFSILDANKDGIINPYEALDVLLSMEKKVNKKIALKDLKEVLGIYEKEDEKELDRTFKEADKNKDGIIQFDEADEENLVFLALMDTDGSKSVTKKEIRNFNFEKAIFLSESQIQEQVNTIFQEFGTAKGILVKKLPAELKEELGDLDMNSDGNVTKKEALHYLKANNSEASFTVKGKVAYMNGTIGTSTPAKVLELLFTHPEVTTIEMQIVPGSINDVANLRASLYVHKFGLNTRVTKSSMIASGGTDFFLAGHKRSVAKGAKIGVHSWGGGGKAATKFPKDHEVHQKYLKYYRSINIPEAFYWFTLKAAPANSIHNMTEEEIKTYKVKN